MMRRLLFAALLCIIASAAQASSSLALDLRTYTLQWGCGDGSLPRISGDAFTWNCAPRPALDTDTIAYGAHDRLAGAGYGGQDSATFSSSDTLNPGLVGDGVLLIDYKYPSIGWCGAGFGATQCTASFKGTATCPRNDATGTWGIWPAPCQDMASRIVYPGATQAAYLNTQDGALYYPTLAGNHYVSFWNGPNCGKGGWSLFRNSVPVLDKWSWVRSTPMHADATANCNQPWPTMPAAFLATKAIPWSLRINGIDQLPAHLATIVEDNGGDAGSTFATTTYSERNFFIAQLGYARIEGWCSVKFQGCPSVSPPVCITPEPGAWSIAHPPGGRKDMVIFNCQEYTDIEPPNFFWPGADSNTYGNLLAVDDDWWGGL